MGSVRHDESHQGGQTRAEGGSQSSGYSRGSTYGQNSASAYGQSSGTQDVWGAQQPALQQIYRQAQNLAMGNNPMGQASQGVATQARNAWADQLTPGGNPYFERSVQGAIEQATQGFNRDILPQMDARGVQAGQYGSERDNLARGQAAGDFGKALSQNVAGMYAQQYGTDRALAGQALGQSGQIQGMQTAPLTTAAGIVGGPTVLGSQQSTNQSGSFGMQQGTNESQNQAFARNTLNSGNWGASEGTGIGILSGNNK